jgi:transcriptional regulator with GAF, ATPase, and Fis domain
MANSLLVGHFAHTVSIDGDSETEREARTAPYLFVVLGTDRLLEAPARHSLARVSEVLLGRGDRAALRCADRLTLTVPDAWVSVSHARLVRSSDGWTVEDAGSRNGIRLHGERIERSLLQDGDIIEMGHTFLLFRERLLEATPDDLQLGDLRPAHPGLATLSPPLAAQFATLACIATSRVSVMVLGETGTGKEVVARAVHELSGRKGAFVAVNCGALAPNLLESELFGYKKGAFSGATEDRLGLVRSADGGTLFLDEIGELPAAAQTTLLRVLEQREVLPVGGTRPIPVDLRLLSATHRPLHALVVHGSFRADLLARLAGFSFELPPLRGRREDLGMLLAALVRRHATDPARVTLSNPAARALLQHHWPLNIREVEKCIEAALVLAQSGEIKLEQVAPALRAASTRPAALLGVRPPGAPAAKESSSPELAEDPRAQTHEQRKQRLQELLARHGGNVAAVARDLGRAPLQIRRWCRRYGLDPDEFRRPLDEQSGK